MGCCYLHMTRRALPISKSDSVVPNDIVNFLLTLLAE